jgi:hypothetical protein
MHLDIFSVARIAQEKISPLVKKNGTRIQV